MELIFRNRSPSIGRTNSLQPISHRGLASKDHLTGIQDSNSRQCMGDQIPCNTYKKVILFRFSFFYVYYKNIINFPSTKSFNYFDLRLLTCLLTRSLHVPSIVFCFLFLTFKFIRLTISEINEVANRFLRSDIQYIFFSMNSNIV